MKTILVVMVLLLAVTSYADQKAVTDTGEQVILRSDGTWEYIDQAQKSAKEIKTNPKKFKKPKDSSFLLKSTVNNSAYWVNTDKWSFEKEQETGDAEYSFKLKGKDLYGMAINEELEMPMETLVHIALENARSVSPDAKIAKQEYRVVNGNKVICMKMTGSVEGMKCIYFGYYYSDASGCTQFLIYTGANLIDKYKAEINDFLNGFDVQ